MLQADLQSIFEQGIIAIIRGVKPEYIVSTVQALYAGGIRAVEATYDQSSEQSINDSLASMRLIHENFKDKVIMGAGTVITVQQVISAKECGAKYIISPNTDVEVIRATKEVGCLSFPGALTPSEIVTAYHAGADAIKLFPAGTMGTGYVKAIMGPLGYIPYLAVGGITLDNMKDFIDIGVKGFGIGGALVSVKEIEAGNFSAITELAGRYVGNWNKFKNKAV